MFFNRSSVTRGCFLAAGGLAVVSLLSTGIASANVVENNISGNNGFTVPTANDILLGTTPIQSGGTYFPADSSLTALTDGIAPANPVNANPPEFFGAEDGTVLTFNLSVTTNINSIVTYTGWQDSGRVNQNYTVSYSTDNGNTYTPLTTVSYVFSGTSAPPGSSGGGIPADTEVQLTSNSGPLITGATNLQFSFANVQNDGVGYTEIAAYVPEPATLGLVAVGGLGLLLLKRRKAV
jgi:hypothetical protein